MMEENRKAAPAFCFVPEMLVDYLNKSNVRTLQPASFFIHGVCLLVDISGFTKLSGQFCDQGKSGIDDLQLATNGFMGQLVDIIYTFGGDIIKFAGDAIICVFSADYKPVSRNMPLRKSSMGNFAGAGDWQRSFGLQETPSFKGPVTINTPSSVSAEVVLRVMHCAKLLTEVQTDKLTVHVAVSCGEMCFGILGGFENRWECLISGPCIHQLSDCLDDAPSKHAVISRRCGRIVREALSPGLYKPYEDLTAEQETSGGRYSYTIHPLPSGNSRIKAVCYVGKEVYSSSFHDSMLLELECPDRLTLIKQFVPLPIADQLEQGNGLHFLAEIREVTTMFMKWDSYDPKTAHRDLLELQACFYQAQRILHNSGAYLRQFLVDDKGCVLIGCWGMPHLSYLDNAHRAVTAAAQIKHKLNKLGMNCSFGITTGDVYCGTVGSPLRQEYAAIGSVVNMSARLMCKANGGILIDDATQARLPTSVLPSLNRLDPIKVKGRDEPLQVYSYTASGSIHVREKVVEDHEISAVCKNTLLSVVDKMVCKDSKFAEPDTSFNKATTPSTFASNLTDLLTSRGSFRSGSVSRSSKSTAPNTPTGSIMRVVLLQGKEGSGRTSVIRWLKNQAFDRQLRVVSTKATKKDSAVDFVIWRRLFQQLMPKDLFLSNETQRCYVRALLKEVFPDQQKVGQLMGFPVLVSFLGITCSYMEGGAVEPEPKMSGWTSLSRKDRRRKSSFEKEKPLVIKDTLFKIFAHLLNVQTSLVIIENIEHADEASLELLVDLTTKLSSRSVICLTALLVDDKNGGRNKNIFQSGMRSVQVDAFHSTAWSKVYQGVILKNKATINITLENYTPEEIDKMLSAALGVREVPPEISQLVQDFSGGAYFWVHEILQFIKEHGAEQFMSAIGENDRDAEPSTPTSNGRGNLVKPSPSPPRHASIRQLHNAKSFVNGASQRNLHASQRNLARNMNVSTRNLNISTRNMNMSTRKLNLSTRNISVNTIVVHQSGAHRTQVKLDKLVLCRFENLHSHVQHVLRTASIIGMTFSSVVLYSIIPRHLKDQMSDCISTLLEQKWLYQDTDNESLYQFAHPHAHQIIYELTPSSERSNTHKAIALHMEFTCGEDRAQFGAICFHYQHCDTDKALQYAVKATAVMLESKNIFEFGDCLDLLFGSFSCCKNSFDVDVLMKLVNDAKLAIERLDLSQRKVAKRSFFDTLLSGCFGDSGAVAPEETLQFKQSFSSDSDKSVDPSDKNYELRAKLVFLEQLDKLNDRLCESYVELVDGDDVSEPKDWQRLALGLSAQDNNVLNRLVRAFSGVYEVNENLDRVHGRHTIV